MKQVQHPTKARRPRPTTDLDTQRLGFPRDNQPSLGTGNQTRALPGFVGARESGNGTSRSTGVISRVFITKYTYSILPCPLGETSFQVKTVTRRASPTARTSHAGKVRLTDLAIAVDVDRFDARLNLPLLCVVILFVRILLECYSIDELTSSLAVPNRGRLKKTGVID